MLFPSTERPRPSLRRRALARSCGPRALVFACVLASLASQGCHHQAPPPDLAPATPPLAERIHGLPALPLPLAQTSPPFQRLFEGVDVALEDRIPLPDLQSEAAYRTWIDHDLSAWLARRGRAIEEAEARVGSVSIADGSMEGVIGSALVGYLYEQTARDVLDSELPQMREARARAIRSAWREQMNPLLSRGGRYFARCADATRSAPVELSAWAATCRDHALRDTAEVTADPDASSGGDQERP